MQFKAYKWTGPDSRTGKVREQVVFIQEGTKIDEKFAVVNDECGYTIYVDPDELTPLDLDSTAVTP